MPDGIFLTPVSGLHYVLHLFDQAVIAIEVSDQDMQMGSVQEAVRRHDDRLAYLEGQHHHLSSKSELRFAASAEFDDWVLNRSEEDSMTIMGLKRLPSDLGNRDWQVAAKRQVNDLIKATLSAHRTNLDYTILYVHNPIRRRTVGQTVLNVRLNSVDVARRFRDMYSGFFRRQNPVKLPSSLKGISVRNKVTLETRIRIAIMTQLGANYKASNPNSSVEVRGYDSRPRLVTIPARGSADQPRTYSFIQAVTSLPAVFSDDSLARIYQVVGGHHPGLLRSLFVVLNDDDRERCQGLVRARHRPPPPSAALVSFGAVSGPGDGAGLDAGFLNSLRSPPPPPPPPPSSGPPSISSEVPAFSRRRSVPEDVEPTRDRSPHDSHRGVHRRRESSTESDRGRKAPKSSKDSRRKKDRRTSSSDSDSSSSNGKRTKSSKSSKRLKKSKRRSPTPSSSSGSSPRSAPTKSSKKRH